MSPIAVVMMLAFMAVIWGGLLLAILRSRSAPPTPAALAEDQAADGGPAGP